MKVLKDHILESVLITGCNQGIGLQFVKHFIAMNESSESKVKIFATSREMSSDLKNLLLSEENVHHVNLDICKPDQIKEAVLKVSQFLDGKGLNLLINNAATMSYDEPVGVKECSPKELTDVFNINVSGTHAVTMAFHPLLKLSAKQRSHLPMCCARGAVFNLSSEVSSIENTDKSFAVSYKVSKAALNMLTKITALDFAKNGIICIAVHPCWVQKDSLGNTPVITVPECVTDMVNLIQNAKEENNGQFIRKDFSVHPY